MDLQNLVEIGNVVLKICEFQRYASMVDNAYTRRFRGIFWGKTEGKLKLFCSFIHVRTLLMLLGIVPQFALNEDNVFPTWQLNIDTVT